MDDMNTILEQMNNKEFKGFRESDCESDDANMNQCKLNISLIDSTLTKLDISNHIYDYR